MKGDDDLPTHKHKRHWADEIVLASTNPPPPSVGGSLAPFFNICEQTVKLKPNISLVA